MASGCDQCVGAVGVAGWAWSMGKALKDVISGRYVA